MQSRSSLMLRHDGRPLSKYVGVDGRTVSGRTPMKSGVEVLTEFLWLLGRELLCNR